MDKDTEFTKICKSNLNMFHCLSCNKRKLLHNYDKYLTACGFCEKQGFCLDCCHRLNKMLIKKLTKFYYYNKIDNNFVFSKIEPNTHGKCKFTMCDDCCQNQIYLLPVYQEEIHYAQREITLKIEDDKAK